MNPAPHIDAAPAMQSQMLDMFLYMGSEWVLHLLIILSILSVAITVERIIHFAWRRDDLEGLREALNARLQEGDIDGARERLAKSRSHVARIVGHGLDAIRRGPAAVEEVLQGAAKMEKLRMERGLAFLGTLGNNAPFIGLFGTVLGIIRAFQDLALNTTDGSAAVMAGIAEALVATAVGLLVALPAVAVFNAFQRRIKSQLVASDALAHSLLAHAKSEGV